MPKSYNVLFASSNIHKYEEAEKYAAKIKQKIQKMRKTGLETIGAYSVENLAFKVLRRNDYLEKLSNAKRKAYDKMLSLKEQRSQ